MNQRIATFVYVACIAGLFYLDRDVRPKVSKALWIPTLWLLIIGSRPISLWLQSGPTISQIDQYSEGSPIDASAYGVLIVVGCVVLASRSREVKAFVRSNSALIFFFSYCALSIVWSDYSFVALKRWIKSVGDWVMVLIVLTDSNPTWATKKLLSRAAFVLLPLSVLFIKYYPDLGRSYNPWTWIPMYCGVTTFKNLLGMTCLVCGLGSLWSLVSALTEGAKSERNRRVLAHAVMVATTIWLLFTANSMTSMSCFAMSGALIILTMQKQANTRIRIAHILTAGAVGLSLCGLFLDPQTMLSSLGRDPTLTGRTAIWHAVLSLHTNFLVGSGFESFWMGDRLERIWEMTEKGIQEAHDGYLEVYLNLGWIGVVLLLNVIQVGYRRGIALFRRDSNAGRLRLAFLTAGVIYSLTEAGFRMMCPIWLLFLLATTTIPMLRRGKENRLSSKPELKRIKTIPEVAFVLRGPFETV